MTQELLSQAEVDFLISRGATVVAVPGADHGGAIDGAINEQFGNAFGL